jgi:TM2 domain-containing membrane protein YozV
MKRKIFIILLFTIVTYSLYSQDFLNEKGSIERINMDFALKNIERKNEYFKPILQNPFPDQKEKNKSVFLAACFSTIVPGTGELYSGHYWQSVLFLGIEAVSWVFAYQYDKKGDEQTRFFQSYANEHWSVVRFANWTERNIEKLVPGATNVERCRELFTILYKEGNKPHEQVNWDILNQIERIIGGGGGKGQGFSHSLNNYGTQQYYELIGKYSQYAQGWDDSDQNDNGDFLNLFSKNFRDYSEQRGKANDYYYAASTFINIIVVNHLVSAIDAALLTYFDNKVRASVTYNSNILPNGNIELQLNFGLTIVF